MPETLATLTGPESGKLAMHGMCQKHLVVTATRPRLLHCKSINENLEMLLFNVCWKLRSVVCICKSRIAMRAVYALF